jgi:hypothetical protein
MNESHELGDAPIEDAYRASMNALARNLDILLNNGATGDNRTTGFVLLVFPFHESGGRCNYISNGADRADVEKLLYEQAECFRRDREAREAHEKLLRTLRQRGNA